MRQPLGNRHTETDHLNPLANVHHQIHIMFDQQDRHAKPVADHADRLQQFRRFGRVHPRRRLIQQQHFHIRGKRPCDFQFALLPVGQLRGVQIRFILQMENRQQLSRRRVPLALDFPVFRGVEQRPGKPVTVFAAHRNFHVVQHRHPGKETDILKCAGNAGVHKLVRLFAVHHLPAKRDCALRGLIYSGQHIENRGLAGAVGTDQPHQLPGFDVHIEIVNRFQPPELNAEVHRFKDGFSRP